MTSDSVKYAQRHNDSLEILHASYLKGQHDKGIRALRAASEQDSYRRKGATWRRKRNIFGSILHSVAGVVTEEQMAVEHSSIQELKKQVKQVMTKELSLYKAVADMRSKSESFEQMQKELGYVRYIVHNDAAYASRQGWRMQIVRLTLAEMIDMATIAHQGYATHTQAVRMIANAGGKGNGLVKHVSLKMTDKRITHVMYYDVGETVYGSTIRRNQSTLVTTAEAKYIVSNRHMTGSPISMSDVKIVSTGRLEIEMYHTAEHKYRVVKKGSIECSSDHDRPNKGSIKILKEGLSVEIDEQTSCRGGGIGFGEKFYAREYKVLTDIPTVHPNRIREHTPQGMPAYHDMIAHKSDKLKAEIEQEIEETQAQIREMSANTVERDEGSTDYVSMTALICALLVLMMIIGLCMRIKLGPLCRPAEKTEVTNRRRTPPTVPKRTSSVQQRGEVKLRTIPYTSKAL